MVQDINFKGKYILAKPECKRDVIIQSAKILENIEGQYDRDDSIKVRVMSLDCEIVSKRFKIGETYKMAMWDFEDNYEVVSSKVKLITRLL